jgi:hypothetical protein
MMAPRHTGQTGERTGCVEHRRCLDGVLDAMMSAGAVVAGRGTLEPAGRLGRRPPRRRADHLLTRHGPDDLRQ